MFQSSNINPRWQRPTNICPMSGWYDVPKFQYNPMMTTFHKYISDNYLLHGIPCNHAWYYVWTNLLFFIHLLINNFLTWIVNIYIHIYRYTGIIHLLWWLREWYYPEYILIKSVSFYIKDNFDNLLHTELQAD